MRSLIAAGILLASGAAFAAPSSSVLDEVQQRGTLKVCTTGDYKPYTFLRDDKSYEGIDIALAESLAKSLGVKIEWVPTTWKTLMPDFLAQCDMAVGGVSISLERQKKAFFSNPITVDGKIPFVRCDEVEKYQTIEQLNQPSVRLIEPPGGTNEAFVRRELPKAQLELFHDNTVIFKSVANNNADVMITDSSEAQYQQRNYPTLCAVNPDKPLQYSEKAFLLPRGDVAFKAYVDQWLHLTKATGEYQRIADSWLAKPSE